MLGDTELTAFWAEYSEPTYINVSILEPETEVKLNLYQSQANAVKVKWDNDSQWETINTSGQVVFTHTYSNAYPYTIQILRQNGNYLLGKNSDTPAIEPITVLSDIQFAFDVTTTNAGAFKGAVSLANANLTRFMTSIAPYAFDGCINLNTLANNTNKLPDSITSIGTGAFRNCTRLTSVIFPAKIQTLGDNTFRNCTGITSAIFNVNSPLAVISSQAFFGCTSLSQLVLPNRLTTIKAEAFDYCLALETINLPAAVTTLGDNVFSLCANLSSVTIPATQMLSMGTSIFSGCPLLQTAGPLNGNYDIKFGWTSAIPAKAFAQAESVRQVVLPDTITEIGFNAFYECRGLETINLPYGLETIGSNSFFYCDQLRELDIPHSVLSIGNQAFAYCSALSRVNLWAPSSTIKINDPTKSWFWWTNSLMTIHILASIELEDTARRYGPYWNCLDEQSDGYRFVRVTNDLQ